MKITRETKFDLKQTVFVVWQKRVVEGVVEEIEFLGGFRTGGIQYAVRGIFPVGNIIHSEQFFGEDLVYATRQEAQVECSRQTEGAIWADAWRAKSKLCETGRKWKIGDCRTEKQKQALRVIRKANEELVKIFKEPGE